MHIEERKVTVREVTEGYFNDAEEGVVRHPLITKMLDAFNAYDNN